MHLFRSCTILTVRIVLLFFVSACSLGHVAVPPAPPPAPAPLPAPPPAPPVQAESPSEVQAEIVRWFSHAGYRPFEVEALVRHARIESGFHPCIAGPGGLRYLFQWGGLRLERLREFSGAPGCPRLDVQLAFADNELRNTPEYWCFWRATNGPAALTALRRGFGMGRC